jgi:multidrug transporter EmrE-like cation transporter
MAQVDLGILAAVIGAVLLGSYFTPVKFSKLSSNQYVFIQLVFASLAMIAILVYSKESFNFKIQNMGFPIVSGIIFAAALAFVFFSIRTIGVGKAAAIYVGLQLVVATVIGFAFFNELGPLSFIQRLETIVGIVLVLAGIVLISVAKL